ncbi:MAG: hypothetical protein KatS3mg102_0069 [Planctomycetota bacterium]|nr:MAG: hypothetical protein KatS3mg102_0069 [Planctomycetota bacterium]
MQQVERWKFAVIAGVTALFLGFWAGLPTTLGIDLAGGTELRYDLDVSSIPAEHRSPELTKATVDLLARRLDSLGMKEMTLRPVGEYSFMVQLPGVSSTEAEQIKNVIATSGNLWFKIVHNSKGRDPFGPNGWVTWQRNDPEVQALIAEIQQRKDRGEYNPQEEFYDVAIYEVRDKQGRVLERFPILVENEDAVPGELLAGADFGRDQFGAPAVEFYMKPAGAARLGATTEKHTGAAMAIVLDGTVISAPTIQSTITDRGIITGRFSRAEVEQLVTVLRSGALPAKPILQSEDTIAPTLGADSIRRGLVAVVAGVAVTLAFMVLYYRLAGLVANVALVLNLIILMGAMSLFGATLTLPGIAGIVLVMGMAVDANILINERIREEFDRGLPIGEAVAAGYRHAFSAIIDSNVTTVLTAIILYAVGTGPIRGFAVTLMIGIVTSMFTALWVTRVLFDWLLARGWYTRPNYLRVLADTNFPFLKKRRVFVLTAVVLLNLGFAAFALRGEEKYGIDFNGGIAVRMRLKEPLGIEEVRARLKGLERGGRRPYEAVEVQRIGEALPDGRARTFQLLLTASGDRTAALIPAAAAETRAAAAAGHAPAAAEVEGASGPEESEAARLAAPRTMQEQFIEDIEAIFGDVLLPDPFGEPRFTTVGEGEQRRLIMEMEVRLDPQAAEGLTAEEVQARLRALGGGPAAGTVTATADPLAGITVTRTADVLLVRTAELPFETPREPLYWKVRGAIDKLFGPQIATPFPFKNAIGASVAHNLRARGIMAVLLSLLMLIGYIAFRFEFKAGLAAAMCLFHDVAVTLGVMMVLDWTSPWTGIDAKINLTTIAAFLTIVGYSINDTIITFDRIRENLARANPHDDREEIMERSINQMLSRTVLTSSTVLLVLVVLALAGVSSLMGFTLAMIAGVVFGTYSSIYVATPILLASGRGLRRVVLAELVFIAAVLVLRSYL